MNSLKTTQFLEENSGQSKESVRSRVIVFRKYYVSVRETNCAI